MEPREVAREGTAVLGGWGRPAVLSVPVSRAHPVARQTDGYAEQSLENPAMAEEHTPEHYLNPPSSLGPVVLVGVSST